MKTLLLQRICSSFASGKATAEKMLRREVPEDEEDAPAILPRSLSALTPTEVVTSAPSSKNSRGPKPTTPSWRPSLIF